MIRILREYTEGDYQITEYTKDGILVSSIVRSLITPLDESEEIEQPQPTETIEEKLSRLEQTIEQNNFISLDIQLSLYEQILSIQSKLNGGN